MSAPVPRVTRMPSFPPHRRLIIAVLPAGVSVASPVSASAKFEPPRSLEVVTEQEGIACIVPPENTTP